MDTKTRIAEVLRTPFTIPTKTIVDDLNTLFLTMAKEMCVVDEEKIERILYDWCHVFTSADTLKTIAHAIATGDVVKVKNDKANYKPCEDCGQVVCGCRVAVKSARVTISKLDSL